MKRWLLVGILVVIGLVCLASVAVWVDALWSNTRLEYIQRTTGIIFPSGLSQVDVFDNTEFYVVAHVKLREENVASFGNKYGFSTTPVSVIPWTGGLKPENRTIPTDAELRYLAGRSENNRWLCALDQNSGRLWMVVFYPDPGGTSP